MDKFRHLPWNKLLHDTWANTNYGVKDKENQGIFPPEKFETLNKIKPVQKPIDWSKDFEEDFEPEPEDKKHVDMRNQVKETLIARGIHYLAWYQPYRYFGGKYWGIYFDVSAMDLAAQNLYLEVKRMNSNIKFGLVLDCFYDMVLRHEVEHLVQDLLITKYASTGLEWQLLHLPGAVCDGLEISATHFELFDTYKLGSKRHGHERDLIRTAWSMTPFPYPYSRWDKSDIAQIDQALLSFLKITDHDSLNSIRRSVGTQGQTKSIRVPIYYVRGNIPLTSVSPHSFRKLIDCKRLEQWLKKSKNTQICGKNFEIVRGGREPNKIRFENGSRSIPLTCHNNRHLPLYVLDQMATQLNMPSKEVRNFFAEVL